jgi:hypothetical protein
MLRSGQRFKSFDEVRERHIWSEALISADANGYIPTGKYDLFTTPAGQAGQGWPIALTDRETDLKSAGRVPDNQNLMVNEIGVTVAVVPDAVPGSFLEEQQLLAGLHYLFCANTVVTINYLTNSVPLGMASDFAQASGPHQGTYEPYLGNDDLNVAAGAQSPAVPAETRHFQRFVTNGMAAPGLRRRFKVPILLQHGETFSWSFNVFRSWFAATTCAYAVRLDMWCVESFVERS